MKNSRKAIKELKLKKNTALFWGDDAEDVKIIEGLSQEMFDKVYDLDEDKVAFLAGDNDGDMFEILFDLNDDCAYDLIEDYNKEWGKYIEIITE
jgi:hypothetical protein